MLLELFWEEKAQTCLRNPGTCEGRHYSSNTSSLKFKVIEIWGELRVTGWPQLQSWDKEASETELRHWEKNEKGRRAAWPQLPSPPNLTKGWEVSDLPFCVLKNCCNLRDLHWILVDRKQSPATPPCRTWSWRVCRPCWMKLRSVCVEA